MKPVKTSEGISGVAKVEIKGVKVRVSLKPETEGEKVTSYVLEKENCPETVREGTFIVNLAGDGKKMHSIRPINGVDKFKVKEFMAQKDKEPAPKTHEGKFGPYQTFAVTFEIVEGPRAGMTVPGSYPFDFVQDHDDVPGKGVQEVLGVKKKSKSPGNDRLWELLDVSGAGKHQVPYKENPLPTLQKIMLREAKVFSGSYKDGWMTSLFADL
jgi:hypothetical protein